MKLNILYEDKNLIVSFKPSGVPSQSDKSFDTDMVSAVLSYERENGVKEPYCALINRLDKPVMGIVLMAKNKKTAALLSNTDLKKEYLAVVSGCPSQNSGEYRDFLVKDGRTNTSKVIDKNTPNAKEAVLEYEVLETEDNERTLVKIRLITGRHHQIRVQFAHRGTPLCGDTKYGMADRKCNGVALCAYRLTFLHPYRHEEMSFEVKPQGEIFENFKVLSD